jgi:hypothetical protein
LVVADGLFSRFLAGGVVSVQVLAKTVVKALLVIQLRLLLLYYLR